MKNFSSSSVSAEASTSTISLISLSRLDQPAKMEKNEVQVGTSEIHGVNTVNTNQSQLEQVPTESTWPTEPKPLILSEKEQFVWALYDTILMILPIGLIVKTGLVILAHHLDETHTASTFDQATSLSRYLVSLNSQLVTLFTIVFVTIISTCVRRFALWKAQQGAYLSELEQLQGSTSLPSTLKLIWSLRSFSFMSVFLVSVWVFYYLGSQAAKEEYMASNSGRISKKYAVIQRADGVSIFSPGINDFLNSTGQTSIAYSDIRDVNYGFASALLTKGSIGEDQSNDQALGFNNGPLIPDFDSVLAAYTNQGLKNTVLQRTLGWVDVSHQDNNKMIYTNFQGLLPYIVDYNPKTKANSGYWPQQILGSYEVSTSYLSVGCNNVEALPLNSFPNGTSYNTSFSLNMTSYRSDAPRDTAGNPLREFEFWSRQSLDVGAVVSHAPGGGIIVEGGTTEYYALKSVCNVTTKQIDMKVSCVTTGCFPQYMRWQNNTNETAATSYSTPFDSEEFGNSFFSNMSLSTGPTLDWVNDWPLINSYFTVTFNDQDPTSPTFSGSVNSVALTEVINTYLTVAQTLIAGRTPGLSDISTIMEQGKVTSYAAMTVKGAPFIRAYRINWAWIPIDFMASTILLAAAIISWRLRLMTLAPDIFGYVSSMTRDNERVPLPTEGSMLSGIDRARMLKNVKVKIGEIQTTSASGERSVGVIGLAPVDTHVEGLQRTRLYY